MTKFIKPLAFAIAIAFAGCAFAATVQTARMGALHPKNGIVVTNVTFDAAPDFTTNNLELVKTIEAAGKANAFIVLTNYIAAAGTTNDLWISDIDGTVLTWTRNGWEGTGRNTAGMVDYNFNVPEFVRYEVWENISGAWSVHVQDLSGGYLAFPVVIEGADDAVYLDWDAAVTNDTLTGRCDIPEYDVHVGPYHLRRCGMEIVKSRAAYMHDIAAYTDAAVSNKADAVRAAAGDQVIVSCSWWDGTRLLTWNGLSWAWIPGTLGGSRELMYEDGRWEYTPAALPYGYTNSVPIYGLPPSLVLYLNNESVTLTRTNEVYAVVTNTYPVAYMDDIARATNDLARAFDLAGIPQTVTNIVRDLSLGGIWDSQLEVWWTPRMRNGSLTYEATTNVDLNAGN